MTDIVDRPDLDAAWKMFYGDGLTLGEIAEKLGCGIYELSPWLTAPANRLAMDGAMEWMARYEDAATEIERLRSALASEREECAKVAEARAEICKDALEKGDKMEVHTLKEALHIAASIRARKG